MQVDGGGKGNNCVLNSLLPFKSTAGSEIEHLEEDEGVCKGAAGGKAEQKFGVEELAMDQANVTNKTGNE